MATHTLARTLKEVFNTAPEVERVRTKRAEREAAQ